jgi:Predicted nucleotide-binding protein containing TIR-like domain
MLPKVFIGCSSESLNIAETIQRLLDRVAEVQPWPGVFRVSTYTLESLLNATEVYDFGIFVFSPDDIVELRGKKRSAVRDNVVFELGLFVGGFGRERNFIILPRLLPEHNPEIHLPSDLLGITAVSYDASSKSNLDAALGSACSAIKQEIERLGTRNETTGTLSTDDLPEASTDPTASALAAMVRTVGIRKIDTNRRGIDYVEFILKAKARSEIKMLGITMRDLQAHEIRGSVLISICERVIDWGAPTSHSCL